jgi:hypothetical protein
MPTINPSTPNAYNPTAVAEAIDDTTDGLGRMMSRFISLRSALLPEADSDMTDFDPKLDFAHFWKIYHYINKLAKTFYFTQLIDSVVFLREI